jgi:thiamine biosynthesis lipoprotein
MSAPVVPPSAVAPSLLEFDAIGTRWQIETPAHAPLDAGVRQAVLDRIAEFDAAYSRFRPDSLVARLAREPGTVEFPPDAPPLFDLYDRLHAATGGAVDPLVGAELELLGYDSSYSLTPVAPAIRAVRDARPHADWASDVVRHGRTVTTTRPVVIDVGAAGKGYLVDLVMEVLAGHGVDEVVVDASGDIRHRGGQGIRIGLEHPLDRHKAIGVATVQNASLCASASNRRAWRDGLHHIVDARTGSPAREVIATWVVASSTALADGLATALFFTGAHQLANTFHFSYVRMYADGRAERSRDFPGELFA